MSRVAIITLHGQGSYKKFAHEEMVGNILDCIDYNRGLIETFPVMYYSKAQANQDDLISRMNINRPKLVSRTRDKIVSSFGDPSTIYHNKEAYDDVMSKIKDQFLAAQAWLNDPEGKIVIIAHSLGTALISNYLWDAQQAGIKYTKVKLLVTTGSPMPVFLSGIHKDDITPIRKTSFRFQWLNFWNKKDVLSFPLQKINSDYDFLVEDIEVKKGWWFKAHGRYSSTKKCYKRVAKEIQYLLEE